MFFQSYKEIIHKINIIDPKTIEILILNQILPKCKSDQQIFYLNITSLMLKRKSLSMLRT